MVDTGGSGNESSVGDSSHQIDAILLDLFVTILENGCEPGQQVLYGRRHLGHPDDVDDGLEGAQDGAQHLGVLFAQVLVQDNLHKITSCLLTKFFPFSGQNRICRLTKKQ